MFANHPVPVQAAITAAGGMRKLARYLGISHAAISKWGQIPVRHVLPIEDRYGIPREHLRPDVYPPHKRRPRKYSFGTVYTKNQR